MKKISDFLDKFQHLESPDQKKEILIKIIADQTGITLAKNQLDIRGKTLFIKAPAVLKNEIFFRRSKIFATFNLLKNLKIENLR